MRDRELIRVTEVTDDSTGTWEVGELEYGVPGTMDEFLKARPENRERLAKFLEGLARSCRAGEPPFAF